jgi:Tol biopolymer transport system component
LAGAVAVVAAAALVFAAATAGSAGAATATTRLSQRGGVAANDNSGRIATSGRGRFVTFSTPATNLASPATTGLYNVYLVDRLAGRNPELVSVGGTGARADGDSGRVNASPVTPDGRFIAFESQATNLVPGPDTNNAADVFVRERGRFAHTTLISAASDRGPAAGARGNGPSLPLAITPDARFVVFLSAATNLVPGDTNGKPDIFLRDRQARITTRISVGTDGAQGDDASRGASISADGRFVAFDSKASNLVPGDDNGRSDVFIRDVRNRTTERVSVNCAGPTSLSACVGTSISADGRLLVYESAGTLSHSQAWLYDRTTKKTTLLSAGVDGRPGNGFTFRPTISASGRLVSFESSSTNLVPGGGGIQFLVYVRDLRTGRTTLASVSSSGAPANEQSGFAVASERGVAFESRATNLVPGGGNGKIQVFFHAS